jgi:pyruvate/2-oxoglutarate/acetoin dehydrogenase E1 component
LKNIKRDSSFIGIGLAVSTGGAWGYFGGMKDVFGGDRFLDMPMAETMYTTFAKWRSNGRI